MSTQGDEDKYRAGEIYQSFADGENAYGRGGGQRAAEATTEVHNAFDAVKESDDEVRQGKRTPAQHRGVVRRAVDAVEREQAARGKRKR